MWVVNGVWNVGHERLKSRAVLLRKEWDWHFLGALAYNSRDLRTSTNGHLRSYGGREASLEAKAKTEADRIAQDGTSIAQDAKAGAENILGDVKQKAGELKQKVVK